jgi:hypothetical protein
MIFFRPVELIRLIDIGVLLGFGPDVQVAVRVESHHVQVEVRRVNCHKHAVGLRAGDADASGICIVGDWGAAEVEIGRVVLFQRIAAPDVVCDADVKEGRERCPVKAGADSKTALEFHKAEAARGDRRRGLGRGRRVIPWCLPGLTPVGGRSVVFVRGGRDGEEVNGDGRVRLLFGLVDDSEKLRNAPADEFDGAWAELVLVLEVACVLIPLGVGGCFGIPQERRQRASFDDNQRAYLGNARAFHTRYDSSSRMNTGFALSCPPCSRNMLKDADWGYRIAGECAWAR